MAALCSPVRAAVACGVCALLVSEATHPMGQFVRYGTGTSSEYGDRRDFSDMGLEPARSTEIGEISMLEIAAFVFEAQPEDPHSIVTCAFHLPTKAVHDFLENCHAESVLISEPQNLVAWLGPQRHRHHVSQAAR